MLDLFAGMQATRRVTEERFAVAAEGRREMPRSERRSRVRGLGFLPWTLRTRREQRPASPVGRADAC